MVLTNPPRGKDWQGLVGIDVETFSSVPIAKHGVHNYVQSEDFKLLLVGISTDQGNYIYDLVMKDKEHTYQLELDLGSSQSVLSAYNASFEWQAINRAIPGALPLNRLEDSAIIAAMRGTSRPLDTAARQLLGRTKVSEGNDLIKLFCVPNETFDFQAPTAEKILSDPELVMKWSEFKHYCQVDAALSRRISLYAEFDALVGPEIKLWQVTERLNSVGWPVDVEMVKSFKRQYEKNVASLLQEFRAKHDPDEELNLRSFPQLKQWCQDRGIRTSSFDEANVEKLLRALNKRLEKIGPEDEKHEGYTQVRDMLVTKQALGGSSLAKLDTLLNQVDHHTQRLHDQYMHLGAAQTYRTSGRGVQMQNLKRLYKPAEITSSDIAEVEDWDNDQIASNLRQVFRASQEDGQLIVGDFASVESRGLAWLAGAEWKLQSFFEKKDLYKVLASSIYHVDYEQVDADQRRTGKVGELSCGYGAGAGAVQSFASGMGLDMTVDEAGSLVQDWRDANPEIVSFWGRLDDALRQLVHKPIDAAIMLDVGPEGEHPFQLYLANRRPCISMEREHPGAKDIVITMFNLGQELFSRKFVGVYARGKDICYHKPTRLKTGDLWKDHFTDPKTKQRIYYKIYGGKLAGIITQSLCRELFFNSLARIQGLLDDNPAHRNAKVIGQFHDEIVIDWFPEEGLISKEKTIEFLLDTMSRPILRNTELERFPLEAEVGSHYRYIK